MTVYVLRRSASALSGARMTEAAYEARFLDRNSPAWKAIERHARAAARSEIERRLVKARAETSAKFPPATSEMRLRGCTEVVWDSETPLALATADALAVAVEAYARSSDTALGEALVRTAWKLFVRARLRVWRDGRAAWKYATPADMEGEREAA